MSWEWLLFGLFIWFSFSTEVATGFGSIIIALALGSMVLPLETMLPLLVALNVLMNAPLLYKLRQQVCWPVFLRQIIPLMLFGMLCGVLVSPYLPNMIIMLGFAVLLIGFSVSELRKMHRQSVTESAPSDAQAKAMPVWTYLAGITHGLYASGGPLLVYALSHLSMNKSSFRATLLTTWLCLNAFYTAWFLVDGSLIALSSELVFLVPVLIMAVITGQWLHQKINERIFKQLVFVLLAICGVIMAVNVMRSAI